MKKIGISIMLIIFSLIFLVSCQRSVVLFGSDNEIKKSIEKVSHFPNMPANFRYYDYRAAAESLDSLVFDFANDSAAHTPGYISDDMNTWYPLGYWIDQERQPAEYNPLVTGYLKRSFGLPTYVGDNRVLNSGSEPLTILSMILGGSYVGIDKSNQKIGGELYNFAEMILSSYDTGSKLVHNVGIQGQSFWYDIFPEIIFARLYDLYRDIPFMKEMLINGADQWLESLPYFVRDGEINYEYVGYNVVLESPTLTDNHIEPPNGGLAFIFYSAYEITKDSKYLDGAKKVLDYLQTYQKNPNYEAMTDYAPYVAAALNSKYGTNYDVGKFLDFLFEGDSAFRPGWGVMDGMFGNYAVDGLVGQSGDYAFSMNSFHLASTLAPMVKYDTRYADDIGKYILNLANNAKIFFPNNISLSHQTMNGYLPFDKNGNICYEGFRNNYNGINGLAMGDATVMFGQPSDLSLYSSAFIGALGGMLNETNVKGILQIDLNKTDSFGRNDYQNYLYYNPYDYNKTIKFNGGNDRYDLFDAVTKTIIAKNVKGTVNVKVPANSSRVVVVLPAKSTLIKSGNYVTVNNIIVSEYKASVNFTGIHSRQQLTADSLININSSAPSGDKVIKMQIFFGNIEVYNGVPVTEFSYDKSLLPDTDYTMKVIITTGKGLTDFSTKRVVAR